MYERSRDWRDVISHTLGLCTDGTVVAAGNNADSQRDVRRRRLIDI
ncbi:MAG: RCC1-like domain-containing protein [Pseudonocardia sp.]